MNLPIRGRALSRLCKTSLAAALFAAAGVVPAADKVTIGMMTTLSGPGAVIGNDIRDGARLGLEHLGGKLGGLPANLVVEDDQQKAEVAIELANRLVRASKVDALMGFSFSNLMIAVAGQLRSVDIPVISSNPGPSQLAGKDCSRWFLSTSWQGDAWAEAMGAYMQKKGVNNVYLMAPNYAAGRDVMAGFKRFFKGTIAGEVYTPLSQLEFSAELAQMRAAKPAAVFAFYPGGLGVNFVKQYSQAGLKATFPLYTAYTVDNTTIRGIGDEAIGLLRTSFWNEDSDNPVNKRFVADFQSRYGRPASEYAVQAYDSVMLLDAGVRGVQGKVEDRAAFMASLRKADFRSIRGNFRFNTNGFPIQDYSLFRVVKEGDRIRSKLEEVVMKDHADAYASQCQPGS
jgi:branched-chain amino acid transport system substrate-binding protein